MAINLAQSNTLLNNLEEEFSNAIDVLFLSEYEGSHLIALSIVQAINSLPLNKRIELLIDDLHNRNESLESEMVHYSSLWFSIAGSCDSRQELVTRLLQLPTDSYVFEFLSHLDEGDNTLGEAGIRQALLAVGIDIPKPEPIPDGKLTYKKLWALRQDVASNFSSLIDAMVYYEENGPEGFAWDVVHDIEKLSADAEASLLISDIVLRQGAAPDSSLYSSLWIELVIDSENKDDVLKQLILQKDEGFAANYLRTLIDDDGSDSDANIRWILDGFEGLSISSNTIHAAPHE